MRKRILSAAIAVCCAGATAAYAADSGSTTVGGLVFFDLSHISLQNENSSGVKSDVPPTGTGFDVKRFYLIVDHKFDDTWSANLTTDAQFTTAGTTVVSTPSGGTANALTNQNSSGNVSEVFIKKLYLQGNFDKAFVAHIGSYDSPWIPFVENLNGYRFVEKMVLDRLGLGTTADWGANATGAFGDNNLLTYSASVVNGGGFKNPTRSKYVDFEGRVGIKPLDWLTIGLGFYDGHLGQVNATNEDFDTNTATRFDAVVGVNVVGIRVGAEYFEAKNWKTVNNAVAALYGASDVVAPSATAVLHTDKANGGSAWASYAFNDSWSVFARYDQAKLSRDVAPDLKDTYMNVGIDYKPIKPLDFAIVYKNEKVENGATTISGGNAGSSYVIGGATALHQGTYDEIGIFARWAF